jgi:hypothetical protein
MKVGYRQQLVFDLFYPAFSLGVLAFGAMTVSAGVVADAQVPASITLIDMSTHCSGSAVSDRSQVSLYVGIGMMFC